MINERTAGILLLGIPVTCIFGFLLLTILAGNVPASFYYGMPVGIIFGIGTWIYLSNTWDPINLRPKNSKSSANLRFLWLVIPGSIVLSRVLPQLIGQEMTSLFMGVVLTWLFLTVGYALTRVWWHRPRN